MSNLAKEQDEQIKNKNFMLDYQVNFFKYKILN
jgi:hypothetical protein